MELDDELLDAPDVEEPVETEVQDGLTPLGDAPDEWASRVRKRDRELAAYRKRVQEAEGLASSMLEQRVSRFADVEPEGLSLTQRLTWLEKMEAKFPQVPASETDGPDEAVAQEAPTPEELRLGSATGGPPTGTSTPAAEMTAKELLLLAQTDPTRAEQLAQAKYRPR